MDLFSWYPICQDLVVYDTDIDHEAFFHKIVFIWRNQVQSVSRRVAASNLVTEDADDYELVIRSLPPQIVELIQRRQVPFEIRKLLSKEKNGSWYCYEVSFEDTTGSENEMSALFFPIQLDAADNTHNPLVDFPYAIGMKILDERSLQFVLGTPTAVCETRSKWLKTHAYPALLRWLRGIDPNREIKPTNRLLPNLESYHRRYQKMKEDYGFEYCKNWKEKTNPQKYVYEDCGIASYLLETWARHGARPKYFADLGCGNGLLVRLLNNEGVAGVGFDIRSRKLWHNMLAGTDLREAVVDPTVNPPAVPLDCDYLIGNHSDELTPWIPVMAARLRCEFFLLPCCPFDFHGKYHARPGKLGSTYAGFLEFTRFVCRRLGYVIEEDRLSIPSSKRLCIIGRIPPEGLPPADVIEQTIADLTVHRDGSHNIQFVPRPKQQPIRNCANIPKDMSAQLTMRIFNILLEADPNNRMENGWRCGGAIPIGQMVKILTPEEKAFMKAQDGGFQTFLKNQHQAFHVFESKVHIRNFNIMIKKTNAQSFSRCWMLANHPDGCPYGATCKFVHPDA